nr:hypothetical protein CFP56_71614 [Quercus suber]
MSEVQQPVAHVVEAAAAADPVATHSDTTAVEPLAPTTDTAAVTESAVPAAETAKPAVDGTSNEVAAAAPVVAPATEEPAVAATTTPAEKVVEPITEGQLAYKGPGLVKSLIPSKKEFWLSDAAVPRSNLDLYLRGEKAEISHPVVAWASQTGKGLLFFNKKGDTNHEHPSSILALYEATDLKKESSHEIAFKLSGHQHTLKAANEAERDGWYMSIEKAAELGKAQKESVHESESYKTELESLSKPAVGAAGAAGVAAGSRSRSANKKTTEATKEERTARAGSDLDDEDAKKTQKSRSTSRGMFNRLKSKKEEAEVKKEEEKTEKEVEKEAEKSGETAPAVIAGGSTLDGQTTAERVLAAPVAEPTPDTAVETVAVVETAPIEEKPKNNKRGSIFGKLGSSWATAKSPIREKTEKDAELKSEVPAKDAGVSETAPQIPEPSSTAEPTTEVVAAAVVEPTEAAQESKPAEANKEQLDAVSPTTQKSGFLSGFFPKRNRSVSPSAHVSEAQKEETPVVAATVPVVAEPATVADPVAPVVAAETTSPVETDKVVEEPSKTEATTTANKRQSVLGSLGRRASKALNRMQTPKKENATPTTEAAHEGAIADATPAADAPAVNGEIKTTEAVAPSTIGDVGPEAVDVGHPQPAATPVVATSA